MSGRHPLDMITENDWEDVLNAVDDPIDKINLVCSHPWLMYHRRLSKLQLWSVLAVLPMVMNCMEQSSRNFESFVKELLNLRLCHSSIRELVDDHLFNHATFFNTFDSNNKLVNFMGDLEKGNNLSVASKIVKKITTQCNIGRMDGQEFQGICNLMRAAGEYLTWIDIDVYQVPNFSRAADIMIELTKFVPNIETFSIKFTVRPEETQNNYEMQNEKVIFALPKLKVLCILIEHCRVGLRDPPILPACIPWPDLSKTFSTLQELYLCLPIWQNCYKRYQIPNLERLWIDEAHIDNPQAEQKVFEILCVLELPKSTYIRIYTPERLEGTKYKYLLDRLCELTS